MKYPNENEIYATPDDFVVVKCMGNSLTFYDVINRWPVHRVTDTYQFILSYDEVEDK